MTLSFDISHDFGAFQLEIAAECTAPVTAIFGPSGAGKTSLAQFIAGLKRPDRATISLDTHILQQDDHFLAPHRRHIGFVFQDARLFPHLNVENNLDFSHRAQNSVKMRAGIIDMLDIGPLLKRRPYSLSGGEKQRVALGRALLSAPKLLILDEPLAALDHRRKSEILPYLERLKSYGEVPILYISHAVDEISRLADALLLIENGKRRAFGSVFDLMADPAFVPFFGQHNAGSVLRAQVIGPADHHLTRLSLGTKGAEMTLIGIEAAPGTQLRLRVLAQDVLIATHRPKGLSAQNILAAVICEIRSGHGPGMAVQLDIGGQKLLARITQKAHAELQITCGQEVFAIVKSSAVAEKEASP